MHKKLNCSDGITVHATNYKSYFNKTTVEVLYTHYNLLPIVNGHTPDASTFVTSHNLLTLAIQVPYSTCSIFPNAHYAIWE